MIAACLEVDKGVEGLWQRGDSKGWKKHANFGQFIPKNYMKAFMAGFPYVFCDEKYWTVNKSQLPWDVIMPFMNEYNDKRKNLLRVVYLVADESMGVWIPKTSKTGGLPHITYERRKPDPLGTMFRNCVEGKTGIFTAHDIVQDDNGQYRKKYHGSPSHMPKQNTIQNHTAQCLRLAEASGIEKGGWFGADAWFGSVGCCVELYKTLGIYSTFIVKHQTAFFPDKVLKEILVARHGKRPGGKKVVMKANIAGCDLFVMAYAWSAQGVAFIVSSCGTTVRHEQNYFSKFENEFGQVEVKELPRPAIAHMLYEFLPLIDEHNRQRQGILSMERKWPTKNCWMRIITTLIGMAVVDVQRWDRNMRSNYNENFAAGKIEEDFSIYEMVNLIATPLRTGSLKYRDKPQPTMRQTTLGDPNAPLQRITHDDGTNNTRDAKDKVRLRQKTCFMCRKYSEKTKNTQWMCTKCGMPLCKANRNQSPDGASCLEEHLASTNQYLGCGLMERRGIFIMPKGLKLWQCEEVQESPVASRQNKRKRKASTGVTPSPPAKRKTRSSGGSRR